MSVGANHLLELQIASNPADSRRVMPAIGSEHRRILDVGCGAGQTLLASSLASEVTAIGIDRDIEALKLGRKIGDRLQFICSRGETLPLRSGYFDLVVSRVALAYMKTRPALSEMARVLRPGGSIWIALTPLARFRERFVESLKRLQARQALHGLQVLANGAESRIERELRALGFENIKVRRNAYFVVTATKPAQIGASA